MSGDARILQARPMALFHQRIAVADAARLNFNSDLPRLRLRNLPFNEFERSTRTAYLCNPHARHNPPKFCSGADWESLGNSGPADKRKDFTESLTPTFKDRDFADSHLIQPCPKKSPPRFLKALCGQSG